MVADAGMSDKVGMIKVQRLHGNQEVTKLVNQEVSRIVNESEVRVRALLTENLEGLHRLAQGLLDKETLLRDEIDRVRF